jgi:hypothetical protein
MFHVKRRCLTLDAKTDVPRGTMAESRSILEAKSQFRPALHVVALLSESTEFSTFIDIPNLSPSGSPYSRKSLTRQQLQPRPE